MKIERAWINLTSKCNNKCVWCYAENQKKNEKEINISKLDEILFFLNDIKCKKLDLVGGEPTLHTKFFDVLSKCNSHFLKVCIITNGRKFSDIEFTKSVAQYRDSTNVAFSVEGIRKHHNDITQTNCFDEVVKGISNCLCEGINVSVNTTLCNQNVDCIPLLYNELISMGIVNFSLNFAIPPLNNSYDPDEYLNIKSVNSVLKEVYTFIINDKINFLFSTPLPTCAFDNTIASLIKLNAISINNMCHLFNGTGLTFDVDGNIVLCTHLSDLVLGESNMIDNKKGFTCFWDVELETIVRKAIRRYPSNRCSTCEFNKNCTGGCPVLWQFDFFYNELFDENYN